MIGMESGYYNNAGSFNVLMGHKAGQYMTGSNNTYLGMEVEKVVKHPAPYSSGGSNVAVGQYAPTDITSVVLMFNRKPILYRNNIGSNSVGVGYGAGYFTTGSYNTFVGKDAGYVEQLVLRIVLVRIILLLDITLLKVSLQLVIETLQWVNRQLSNIMTGGYNDSADTSLAAAGVSGNHNVVLGYYAGGKDISSGEANIAIGRNSLSYSTTADDNIAIGQYASHRTGQYNAANNTVVIGRYAGYHNQGNHNLFMDTMLDMD